jgi:hypothetical protein
VFTGAFTRPVLVVGIGERSGEGVPAGDTQQKGRRLHRRARKGGEFTMDARENEGLTMVGSDLAIVVPDEVRDDQPRWSSFANDG